MDAQVSEFKLTVIDIVDQPDGTALVTFDINKETREFIKQTYGWKRWNTKKFQQLFIQAIENYVAFKKEGPNDGSI